MIRSPNLRPPREGILPLPSGHPREMVRRPRPDGQAAPARQDRPGPRARLALAALLTCLMPFSFAVGGLTLSPSRMFFLIATLPLLAMLLAGRFGRVTLVDGLVFLNVGWMVIAIFIHNPPNALTFAGLNATMILGGYLVGRASVRSIEDFHRWAMILCIAVLFSAPFALVEAITGRLLFTQLFDLLPGMKILTDGDHTPRLGLNRVQFAFAHPIHYGLFCTMAASMSFIGLKGVMGTTRRLTSVAVIVLCCFLSVSSGPFLALMAQIALILWMVALHSFPRRWVILVVLAVCVYVVLEILSDRPAIYAIVTTLSFNPTTANVRRVLFDYGFAQIWRTPVFGVGFKEWGLPPWMSGSVDNFWLLLALIYGLPTFFGLLGALCLAIFRIALQPSAPGSAYDFARHGWSLTLVSLMLTLATVAIWNEIMAVFYLFLGAGVWMLYGDPEYGRQPDAAAPEGQAEHIRASPYTRFPLRKARTHHVS